MLRAFVSVPCTPHHWGKGRCPLALASVELLNVPTPHWPVVMVGARSLHRANSDQSGVALSSKCGCYEMQVDSGDSLGPSEETQ